MRRILATLLLMATSLTLAPLALLAGSADSELPACCRRDGKHKCAMSDMDADAGPALRGVSQCPMFPARISSGIAGNAVGVPVPRRTAEISISTFLTSAEQVETLARISFSRSRQKRGPPSSSTI